MDYNLRVLVSYQETMSAGRPPMSEDAYYAHGGFDFRVPAWLKRLAKAIASLRIERHASFTIRVAD